jgi:long-chain-fatty-acid--[acyl-carrier-protein] ligase
MKKRYHSIWISCLFYLVKALISLRYRIKVTGLEELKREKLDEKGGILFLPNHPAELDPVMLMILLWKPFHPHPLVVEHFYYLKGIEFFMDLVGALPLPLLDGSSNKWKAKQIDNVLNEIQTRLKEGENFLIYPGGKLKLGSQEVIGASSFVHNLINACPQANVVLMRTRGLWGSSFSRAITGDVPDFGKTLFKGLKIILKNAIFFTPRREVTIEIEKAPADFPFAKPRLEFNQYLEKWYNTPEDPLQRVSFSFWKRDLPEIAHKEEKKEKVSKRAIDPSLEEEILAKIAVVTNRPASTLKREMRFSQDLGLDSLDTAELSVFLEQRYDVTDVPPGSIQTVEDLLYAAAGYQQKAVKLHKGSKKTDRPWQERGRPPVELGSEKTLQEAFFATCDRMQGSVACADVLSGILTYRKLKRAVLILRQKIEKLPGQHTGILLPSSVAANLAILATLACKKIPVMLNWTAGKRALDHALDVAKVEAVISSYRFLSRLENSDLGHLEEKCFFLEDFRRALSVKEKLLGLWHSLKNKERLCKKLGLDQINEEEIAVFLFTSGTETLPKGVPLTHKNLLSNQRAALSCAHLKASDSLYGILPPFHSFGFSVTGLLPLLSGLKVFYAPDPTDAQNLVHDIATQKPSLFIAAPSFIMPLFRIAGPDQLKSLRLIVSGAEKTPSELFDLTARLGEHVRLLEGYGITECSPIVTLDPLDLPHKGVGKPLPGVELCIIDPETTHLLPLGEEGEVCVHGPGVFKGYLGEDVASPFLFLNGKKWYRSADRGALDHDNTLFLLGRLKRFIKIGGEMVSLGGLETELLKLVKDKNWPLGKSHEGPALAVSVKEKENEKPLIILFTTFEVSRDEVNTALRESGFSRIVKIAEVKKVQQIPLTGTGKTHYRLLDELLTR